MPSSFNKFLGGIARGSVNGEGNTPSLDGALKDSLKPPKRPKAFQKAVTKPTEKLEQPISFSFNFGDSNLDTGGNSVNNLKQPKNSQFKDSIEQINKQLS